VFSFYSVTESEPLVTWDYLYYTAIHDPDALHIASLYGVEYCLDQCIANTSVAEFCNSVTYSKGICYFHDKILDEIPNSAISTDSNTNTFEKVVCQGE